jgi:hypothetical protein
MRWLFLLTLVFACLPSVAQELSGKWEGNYSNVIDMFQMEKLVVDLEVRHDTVVSGSSHLYYSGSQYEHYTITGIYDQKDSTIFFMEDGTIAVNVGFFNLTCLGNYTMKLSVRDSIMRLEGRWKANAKISGCPSSRVYLEKKLPRKMDTTHTKRTDPNLKRGTDIQKLIKVADDEKDSIRMELVDNAQVDNDVVSVYLDDSLILSRQKLTATPHVFHIALSRKLERCSIKMVAESMGSVPPCTALMVVATRKNRYNVTLSSDFGTNGVLKLFLKE